MDDDDTILEELDTIEACKNLKIFDRNSPDEPIPEGFTSTTVCFDLRPSSSLNWANEIKQVEKLIQEGYKICFELDLGLFSENFRRELPTLILAINEFHGRILTRYLEHTEAVIFYRADTPFSSLEDRDIKMDFLELLRLELPDNNIYLLLFDCKEMQDPYSFARMFSLDRYSLFTLALKDSPLILSCCSYNSGPAMLGYIGRDLAKHKPEECSKGIIMPSFSHDAKNQKPLLESIVAKGEHFKIISEEQLAIEWEGLDILYVENKGLAATTLRTIAGFEAAGGIVLTEIP